MVFVRFAAVLALIAAGTAWMMFVAAPVLTGVPATWANAPLLLVAAPGFAMFIAAFIVEFCHGQG